jgi:hypothetical protein
MDKVQKHNSFNIKIKVAVHIYETCYQESRVWSGLMPISALLRTIQVFISSKFVIIRNGKGKVVSVFN